MKTIIAFTGLKTSGKDTAAQILIDKYGYEKVCFADGLRRVIALALGEDVSYFTDTDTKEQIDQRIGKSRRYWLQIAGTEWFRSLYPNIWVDYWVREIEKHGDFIVCTDMRFLNELCTIHNSAYNTQTIRVVRPGLIHTDLHKSESHILDLNVDHEVSNSGSIDELHEKVMSCLPIDFGLIERVGTTTHGNNVFVKKNSAGGYAYSTLTGGGAVIYDTAITSREEIQIALDHQNKNNT
jgi:hypothetical protein